MREMSLNTFFVGDNDSNGDVRGQTTAKDVSRNQINAQARHARVWNRSERVSLDTERRCGGASSIVGTVASVAYVDMLGRYVDRIEDRPSQKQLLAPMSAAVFEVACNNTELLPFDFNYTETLICFLSYKIALFLMAYRSLNEKEDD